MESKKFHFAKNVSKKVDEISTLIKMYVFYSGCITKLLKEN